MKIIMIKRIRVVLGMLVLLAVLPACAAPPIEVTFAQLVSTPQKYTGRTVTTEAFCFSGFETIVLAERLEPSGLAAGHLNPKGQMVWIEGGIPKPVFDQLYEQHMMGPSERYGKVRVTGKFEYGSKYGHLDGFNAQITPAEMTLVAWSPPA